MTVAKLNMLNAHIFSGITIDDHLDWKVHIDNLSNNISRNVGMLNKLKHFLPVYIMKTLYYLLIASHLGAIQVLRNAIFLEIGPPPTPSQHWTLHLRNAFFQKIRHPPPPPLSALRNTWMAPYSTERAVEREREREITGNMTRPIRKTWTESQPDKKTRTCRGMTMTTIPETMKKYN